MTKERAVLAGGCFWGMQDLIRKLPGVLSTRVGYTGGDVKNATYRNHGTHAEGIEIWFESDQISYRKLLEFFFQIHDPSTLNRQGNDIGSQYRSVIFTHSDEQVASAQALIVELERQRVWDDPIVTEVAPAPQYWPGEDYHQNYFARNPFQGYCMMVVGPKVAKFRKQFAHRLSTVASAGVRT